MIKSSILTLFRSILVKVINRHDFTCGWVFVLTTTVVEVVVTALLGTFFPLVQSWSELELSRASEAFFLSEMILFNLCLSWITFDDIKPRGQGKHVKLSSKLSSLFMTSLFWRRHFQTNKLSLRVLPILCLKKSY